MKNWVRYARALDLRLSGLTYEEVGREMGISKEMARHYCRIGGWKLARRVFGPHVTFRGTKLELWGGGRF